MLECHLTDTIVKTGVAGPASDWGGEAKLQAPMRMRPPPTTTKTKPRSSRHVHAAAELAAAVAAPLVSRKPPEALPSVLKNKAAEESQTQLMIKESQKAAQNCRCLKCIVAHGSSVIKEN